MKTPQAFLIVSLVVLLLLTGCSQETPINPTSEPETVIEPTEGDEEIVEEPEPTNAPPPTLEPTTAPSPTPEPTNTPEILREVYWEDDFSDFESGWEHYNEIDGILDYEQDGYRMLVQANQNLFWVLGNLDEELTDFQIEIDAQKLAGPDQNQFGVMCRFDQAAYSYYTFLITSEGQAAIGKKTNQGLEIISSEDGSFSDNDAINTGNESNIIEASCVGSTLSLYVNRTLVLQVEDDEFSEGLFGLLVGTTGIPGTDILFDNLKIYLP